MLECSVDYRGVVKEVWDYFYARYIHSMLSALDMLSHALSLGNPPKIWWRSCADEGRDQYLRTTVPETACFRVLMGG